MAALAPTAAGLARLKLSDTQTSSQDAGTLGDQDLFSYRNLLQELLAALLGFTGDVFVDAADATGSNGNGGGPGEPSEQQLRHPSVCTVRLAGDLSWVAPGDRQLLDRLASLGFHFKQLRRFVERERAAAPRSAYRQALCAGVSEFLGVYQDSVLELQRQLLQRPAGGLAALQYQLLPMQQLLPQLHQLAWELRRPAGGDVTCSSGDAVADGGAAAGEPDGAASAPASAPAALRGAELLRALQRRALNGQPALQAVFQRLQWHCHQVLFQQLTAWWVAGGGAHTGIAAWRACFAGLQPLQPAPLTAPRLSLHCASLSLSPRMVHGLLVDEGGEFFVQHAYSLPDRRPDGQPWSREDVTYHEWHAAFGVGVGRSDRAAKGRGWGRRQK
jgi:hypothetical protein